MELGRITKFAVVGAINTAIDFSVFVFLLYQGGFSIIVSNTVAYCVGIINSFLMNKYWTFSDSKRNGHPLQQFPLFVALNLIGLGLSNLTVWSLALVLHAIIAKVFAIGVTFVWNYWSNRRFVYKAI